MALKRNGNAVLDERTKIDEHAILLAMPLAQLSRLQHLFHRTEKPIGVRKHVGIKLLPLCLVHGPALKSFQIKSDTGDRSF